MKYLLHFLILFLMTFCGCASDSNESSHAFLPEQTNYPEGEKVYGSSCIACHQKDGKGVEGAFPPLAQSDYLLTDKLRAIKVAKHGIDGEIVVNGQTYNGVMAPQGLSNEEVKNVVNYILNTWGNNGGEVTISDVTSVLEKP